MALKKLSKNSEKETSFRGLFLKLSGIFKIKRNIVISSLVLVLILCGGYVAFAQNKGMYPFAGRNPTVLGASTEKQVDPTTQPTDGTSAQASTAMEKSQTTGTIAPQNSSASQPDQPSENQQSQPNQPSENQQSQPTAEKTTQQTPDNNAILEACHNAKQASINLATVNYQNSVSRENSRYNSDLLGYEQDMVNRGLRYSGAYEVGVENIRERHNQNLAGLEAEYESNLAGLGYQYQC